MFYSDRNVISYWWSITFYHRFFMSSDSKISGVLFFFIIITLSVMYGVLYVGNTMEKISTFLSSIVMYYVIASLFACWRFGKVLKDTEAKVLCIAFPVVTCIEHLYPIYEYSEQTPQPYWLLYFSLDLTLAIFISCLLWRNRK
jgi:fumarate reductase subunit C